MAITTEQRPGARTHRGGSRHRVIALALVILLAPCAFLMRRNCASTYSRSQRYEDVYYLPPNAWLKPLALGFDSAAADLLWMRAILYFGKEMIVRGETRHIYDYIDAMLTLDPDFRAVYKWSSTAGLYHSGKITPEDGYRVVAYLERAVDRWPEDGELFWELGSVLRFELAPITDDPEEKRRLSEAAMDPLTTAARLGAGPPWLASLNAQLLNKLGKTEQAIRHLEEMYEAVDDQNERQQIEFQLARLRSERYATAFKSAMDELQLERRENYPYLSTNLYVLVGPRISGRRNQQLEEGFGSAFVDLGDAEDGWLDEQGGDETPTP